MRLLKFLIMISLVAAVSSCGKSKFKSYYGPKVTKVVINKGAREMELYHHNKVLKSYDVDLGFAPVGHKQFEGDGKTPEGQYFIDRRNPNSKFHLSLGISYPNQQDVYFAETQDKSPGGEIFIHGQPNGSKKDQGPDWTAGCISVSNREIERIYAMIKNGTPVTLNP